MPACSRLCLAAFLPHANEISSTIRSPYCRMWLDNEMRFPNCHEPSKGGEHPRLGRSPQRRAPDVPTFRRLCVQAQILMVWGEGRARKEWFAVVEWFGRPEIETDEVRERRISME